LTEADEGRIVSSIPYKEAVMSLMCSLAVCKAQQGMCGHEKVMLSMVLLAALGFGAYVVIG
jgi:hypothetical protein